MQHARVTIDALSTLTGGLDRLEHVGLKVEHGEHKFPTVCWLVSEARRVLSIERSRGPLDPSHRPEEQPASG